MSRYISKIYGTLDLTPNYIATGGEGEVWGLQNSNSICVKLYFEKYRTAERETKIKYMVQNPPSHITSNNYRIGWPIDLVYENNKFVGFIMPLAFNGSEQLVNITIPKVPKRLGPTWEKFNMGNGPTAIINRLKLMHNIAITIYQLHATNKYVIQDFKPQNILVTNSGNITVCDLDSIQISNNNEVLHYGTAQTPGYAPPEYLIHCNSKKKTSFLITKKWDYFSIAVVFYQMLFGLHPYTVTPKQLAADGTNDISQNIINDLFPFGNKTTEIAIYPKLHDRFKIIPQSLRELFIRAFTINPNNRPSLEEWGKTLHQIIIEAENHKSVVINKPVSSSNSNGTTTTSNRTPSSSNRTSPKPIINKVEETPKDNKIVKIILCIILAILQILFVYFLTNI